MHSEGDPQSNTDEANPASKRANRLGRLQRRQAWSLESRPIPAQKASHAVRLGQGAALHPYATG